MAPTTVDRLPYGATFVLDGDRFKALHPQSHHGVPGRACRPLAGGPVAWLRHDLPVTRPLPDDAPTGPSRWEQSDPDDRAIDEPR